MVRVVGRVRDHVRDPGQSGDQGRCLRRIAPLARGRHDPQRQAERVHADVQLGGQAAP